jgi:hypothetical protein
MIKLLYANLENERLVERIKRRITDKRRHQTGRPTAIKMKYYSLNKNSYFYYNYNIFINNHSLNPFLQKHVLS